MSGPTSNTPRGGYPSSETPVTELPQVPTGPAPGARACRVPMERCAMSEGRMTAEQTPDIEAALDAALSLIGPDHVTPMGKRVIRQALAPVLAAAVREARAAAWDEGHRLTAPHSDACDPDCPNPYRADRIDVDAPEGGEGR